MDPSSPLPLSESPRRAADDAGVVGSGPNGLAAAITLARAGRSVLLLEAAGELGGGLCSAELTLPGFIHDVCSTVHALAQASPFFQELPLERYGVEWVHPQAPLAHPLPDGGAAVAERSLEATAAGLGDDGEAYRRLLAPFVRAAGRLMPDVLGPPRLPRHPFLLARLGLAGLGSAVGLSRRRFRGEKTRGLFAGLAAHSVLPLERPLTAAVGLLLGLTAHAGGWPFARGGSGRFARALAAHLLDLGGEAVVNRRVASLRDLPRARAVLLDVTPRQLASIAGEALPAGYRRRLERFRYGPGVFKLDWALDGPIPWRAQECARAGTVHVGGTLEEVAAAERAAWEGEVAERPFLLVSQQSLFDASRAPPGKHTAWGYCHVPHGSPTDMTERIEAQMERFAPGFRARILARHAMGPADLERRNENLVGGDITGGVMDFRQLLARPVARLVPYATPARHLFICSASTPPGGGVHGMCGYWAAQAALRSVLRA
jgi:phytoene dehydrogenase-like protein